MFSYDRLNGNRKMAQDIFDATLPEVHGICSAILCDGLKADGIVCDLYKKIFNDPDRLKDVTDFSQWIKKAACVAAIVTLKRENAHIFDSLQSGTPMPSEIGENVTATDIAFEYEKKIAVLSPLSRCAAICYHYCNMTDLQIAKITNADINIVRLALERVALQIKTLRSEVAQSAANCPMPEISAIYDILFETKNCRTVLFDEVCFYPQDLPVKSSAAKSTYSKQRIIITTAAMFAVLAIVCAVLVRFATGDTTPTSPSAPSVSVTEKVSSPSSEPKDISSADIAPTSKAVESDVSSTVSQKTKNTSEQPQYLFTENIYRNADGETTKSEKFEYNADGKVKKAAVVTPVYSETLTYKYSDNGKKRTTVNDKGTTVETAKFDKYGNVTSITFTKEKVTYKWSYTFEKDGKIKTAAYTSVSSGKYTYTYDNKNRLASEVHTCDGDTFKTNYEYDDNGMVIKKVLSDENARETIYTYTYDYDNLTYNCKINNGKYITGKIKAAF